MPPTTHRRKITQKELKAPDEFTTLVENARDFLVDNLTQVIISTAVVLVVGVVVIGVYYYERHRDNLASTQFYDAITALNAGQNKQAETQFKQLAEDEPGRRLGRLARFYLASAYLADGDLSDARDSLIAFLAWVGLGADGLSSSAYGPEEAFRTLGQHTYLAIGLAIATALTVLIISASYSSIIEQFPTGGGGYAIEVLEGARRVELAVTPGMFANGYVQVEGRGLHEGQTVIEAE